MRESLAAFARSFVFAFAGIVHVFRTQRNMRVHLLISIVIAMLGWWLNISTVEWAIIALTIGVVLAAEMMNTVIESTVDLASPAQHPLARIAKDVAAGVVLILAICAVLVGIFIFLPKLLVVISH